MLFRNILTKFYLSFFPAPILATVTLFITPLKNMIVSQSDFFTILTMALLIDLVIGIIKYIKLNKFSFRALLTGLIVKVMVAYGGLLLFLAFSTLEDGPIGEWFLLIAKFTVLLYPSGSALSNMYIVTDGKFPPIKLMKKLEAFDQLTKPIIPSIEKIPKQDGNPYSDK